MHRAALSYSASSAGHTLSDDEVVRSYSHLIDRTARRISARTGNTIEPGDLWSAGALGLLDAYRRFDPARAVKFESFAEHRIRGAMMDELREMDHLPRRLRAEADRVRQARHALSNTLGRDPSIEEVAAYTGLAIDDASALDALSRPVVPLTDEIDVPSLEMLQDEKIDQATRITRATRAIEQLNPRLQLVLSLHYTEGFTYKEIALTLEVTEARVCQLHGEAIKKIQAILTESP